MAIDTQPTVIWEPNEGPQTAFVSCPIFEVAFGGARGGGKTDGSLGDWLNHSDQYKEHAIGLMIRRSLTELSETIERSKVLFTPLGASYNSQQKMWRMSNGARLTFAYLENDTDANNYQGWSITRLYVEEAGNFPSPLPIFKLMATLRSGAGVPCGVRLTFNPGGAGHVWVKRRYVDPNPSGWEVITEVFSNPFTNEDLERERIFIPSKVIDNPHLGADYIANLQMLGNPALVKAWLEGDFSITSGAYFPEWDENRHVIKTYCDLPRWWYRYRVFDWGTADPAYVGWLAISDGQAFKDGEQRERWFPKGALILYNEWFIADPKTRRGLRLRNEEIATGIIAMSDISQQQVITLTDSKPFQDDGGDGPAAVFERNKCPLTLADTSRVAGWSRWRDLLIGKEFGLTEDNRPILIPMFYVMPNCIYARELIPALQRHGAIHKQEDAQEHGEPTHVCDPLRYGAMAHNNSVIKHFLPPMEVQTNKIIQQMSRNKNSIRELVQAHGGKI